MTTSFPSTSICKRESSEVEPLDTDYATDDQDDTSSIKEPNNNVLHDN